jgi:biotin carboxyl carrier protein
MRYEVIVGEQTFIIEINQQGQVTVDGQPAIVDFGVVGSGGLYSLLVNNESFEALVENQDGFWRVLMRGNLYDVQVIDERSQLLRARSQSLVPETGEVFIKAPMPGLVVAIPVQVGQQVGTGENIIILESMKMENELKAPRAGRIERIAVNAGDSVEQNQTLVVIV